jgi:hypothetical protein
LSLAGLLAQTWRVLPFSSSGIDQYGNPTTTFGPPVPYPCRLEQLTEQEILLDRNLQIGDLRLFLPPGAVITGRDRGEDDEGRIYEVIGPPKLHRTPRGPHHIEAVLRRFDD